MDELPPLALQQALHRNARRLRHAARDIRTRHAVVQHRKRALRVVALRALALRRQLLLELRDRCEPEPRRALVPALPLRDLELVLRVLKPLLQVLYLVEPRAVGFPDLRQLLTLFLLLFECRLDFLDAEDVGIVLERLALDFKHHDLPVESLELVGLAFLGQPERRGRLVNEVDCLVGRKRSEIYCELYTQR